MIWHWPQITYAALLAFGLIVAAAEDGKTVKRSFPITLVAVMIGVFLQWQGGFWTGGNP